MKLWSVAKLDKTKAGEIQSRYELPAIVAMLLQIRNITTKDEIESFLYNDSFIADPFEIKDMDKAVERINKALDCGEPMEVNMPKSVSWCPCMGAKCRGNNPPFCSIKTSNCKSVQTERLKQALQKAEAVIIGAGAGLSTSAGFTYSGERFEKWFGDFRQVHGFSDMYSGGFFPYKTLEEYWAYWSRYIYMQPGRMQFMPA